MSDFVDELLRQVARGELSPEAARVTLASGFTDLGHSRVDHARAIRCGFPEVIFAAGKTPAQVVGIARELLRTSERLLVTRVTRETAALLAAEFPMARLHEPGRVVTIERGPPRPKTGLVLVISAGTSDMAVAEEARLTAEIMDAKTETLYDAGVAGIHRLMSDTSRLRRARALVVVAGMEGALPSVVAGLVARPVIAVPTSVGYGASFGGIAALLGMLNSCSAGVSVVNIDNGFGAGYVAALINRDTGDESRREPASVATPGLL